MKCLSQLKTVHRAPALPTALGGNGKYLQKFGNLESKTTNTRERTMRTFRHLKDAILVMTLLILISLLIYVKGRPQKPSSRNGLELAIAHWGTSNLSPSERFQSSEDFSRDIIPIPCHSHNDYWRRVPLLQALAAGCTSVEADVWLTSAGLLVGHDEKSLNLKHTLESFYIDPLVNILTHQNRNNNTIPLSISNETMRGIFDTQPSQPIVLLVDIKTGGPETFDAVVSSIEPLRARGWLTFFDGKVVTPGLITVVGTGNTPFDSVVTNTTYRNIFFDAPLGELWSKGATTIATRYAADNSLYASASFRNAVGRLRFGFMRPA
ncbi:MAG: hypothetical protein Q9209_004732 [Squamulea sp. 1 TL-2023]